MIETKHGDRRSFLKAGAVAGTAMIAGAARASAQADDADASSRPITKATSRSCNSSLRSS